MPGHSRPSLLVVATALVLLLAPQASAQSLLSMLLGGGSTNYGSGYTSGSSGRPSYGAFSSPSGYPTGYPSSRPSSATATYRPSPGSALPTMPVRYGSSTPTYGATTTRPYGATTTRPTSSGGFSSLLGSNGYSRPASSSGSMLPLAMGALAGTAAAAMLASSGSSGGSSQCNGYRPECYKNYCARVQRDCPAAQGRPLVLVRCPKQVASTYTECWATEDVSFVCLGRARPSARENIDAYCTEKKRDRQSQPPRQSGARPGPAPAPRPSRASPDDADAPPTRPAAAKPAAAKPAAAAAPSPSPSPEPEPEPVPQGDAGPNGVTLEPQAELVVDEGPVGPNGVTLVPAGRRLLRHN